MTSNPKNKSLLNEFVSKTANNSLEEYFKDETKAWSEDLDGETRVYVVKDEFGKLALFFSVKCGLLVEEKIKDKLSDEHLEFVNAIIDVKKSQDEQALNRMYEAGSSMYGDEIDRLFKIAGRKIDSKIESAEIGQSENTINVSNCISAIELRHICKNEEFAFPTELDIPLGLGIFWEVIVPMLIDITNQVGCKYIYLFAADKTICQDEVKAKKLISHYKNNFKFSECDESIKFIKPEYDNYCYGLIQNVSRLKNNRSAFWYEFSDI